jgi:hypothetical protein
VTGMGIVVAGGICAAVLVTRNAGRRQFHGARHKQGGTSNPSDEG